MPAEAQNLTPLVNVRRRQRRAVETRKKILTAASHEFAACGFIGASTRKIARQAGVGHRLVLHHFGSKEALWQSIVSEAAADLAARYRKALEAAIELDDCSKLRAIQETFIRFVAAHPYFASILSHARTSPGPLADFTAEPDMSWITETTVELIRSAQRQRRYVSGDANHLLLLFYGAAARVMVIPVDVERLLGRSPYSEKLIKEHIHLCQSLFFRELPSGARSAARRASNKAAGQRRR